MNSYTVGDTGIIVRRDVDGTYIVDNGMVMPTRDVREGADVEVELQLIAIEYINDKVVELVKVQAAIAVDRKLQSRLLRTDITEDGVVLRAVKNLSYITDMSIVATFVDPRPNTTLTETSNLVDGMFGK